MDKEQHNAAVLDACIASIVEALVKVLREVQVPEIAVKVEYKGGEFHYPSATGVLVPHGGMLAVQVPRDSLGCSGYKVAQRAELSLQRALEVAAHTALVRHAPQADLDAPLGGGAILTVLARGSASLDRFVNVVQPRYTYHPLG